MNTDEPLWFPSVRYVELVTTRLVPVLFPQYDESSPDFQYLGGGHGRGLLESALAQPRHTFGGEFLYRSIFEMAAALIWSMTKNHPFNDGNKRAALATGFSFLAVNNHFLVARQRDAIDVCLKVAKSAPDFEIPQLAEWIRQHSWNDEDIAKQIQDPSHMTAYFRDFSDSERSSLANALEIIWRIADIVQKHRELENHP